MTETTVQRRRRADEEDLQSRVEALTPAQRAHFDSYVRSNLTISSDKRLREAAVAEVEAATNGFNVKEYDNNDVEAALEHVKNAVVKPVPSFTENLFIYLVSNAPRMPLYNTFAPLFERVVSFVYERTGWDDHQKSLEDVGRSKNSRFSKIYKMVEESYKESSMGYTVEVKFKIISQAQYNAEFSFPGNKTLESLMKRMSKSVEREIYKECTYELKSTGLKKQPSWYILEARKLGLSSFRLEREFFNILSKKAFQGIGHERYDRVTKLINYLDEVGFEDEIDKGLGQELVDDILMSVSYHFEQKPRDELKINDAKNGVDIGLELAERINYVEAIERFEDLKKQNRIYFL